jgi:ATP-dependent Clp protease adaptor protein ClpS
LANTLDGISLKGEVLVVTDDMFWHFDGWRLLDGWRLVDFDGFAPAGFRLGAACALETAAYPVSAAKDPRQGGEGSPGSGTAVIARPKTQVRHPNMYRVLLLNDDYTPMDFVVSVLKKYFNKGPDEATRIMLHVHQHGVGECGIYTYEIAETKVTQVMDHARKHQHPLQCIMEKK